MRLLILIIIHLSVLTGCTFSEPDIKTADASPSVDGPGSDPHSYARPDIAKTKHLTLDLSVNFDRKMLSGSAHWLIENNDAQEIVFDVRDLNILKITTGPDSLQRETTWRLGETQPYLGRPLIVNITPAVRRVNIYYETTPDGAAALDWLDPDLTADKKQPFLFTQGQAILTRTWIPIQDSPGIRITYDATIRTSPDLLAVMSATNPQTRNERGVYAFRMSQPIPAYLIALAVGDLRFQAVSARTGVYAEPSVVVAAADEFAEMDDMLRITEDLYGPYVWERYDVIVLPPSFPFGGMENPRLTFATPTILAGDRSLVSLIAHELAHSWSGNLVTNATWNDFWLNEGFTVYLERRIMEAVYGRAYADMLAELGFQDLENTVKDLGLTHPDTRLKLELHGRDADDGMTDIAYEKGAALLTLLEQKVGRPAFDEFLKKYFQEFKFKTLTTEAFVDYLREHLIEPNQVSIDLNSWIYEPGIPADAPRVVSARFANVDAAIRGYLTDRITLGAIHTSDWTTHEWLHFIRQLPDDLSLQKMNALDDRYGFSTSGNAEILAAWFEQSIRSGYSNQNLPAIESFLVRIGRRKFLTPLYRAFKETGQLGTAQAIYAKARPNYHSVSRSTMDALLEV